MGAADLRRRAAELRSCRVNRVDGRVVRQHPRASKASGRVDRPEPDDGVAGDPLSIAHQGSLRYPLVGTGSSGRKWMSYPPCAPRIFLASKRRTPGFMATIALPAWNACS